MDVFVPEDIKEAVQKWNPVNRGKVGVIFALLADDAWRSENRENLGLSLSQKIKLGLFVGETLWAVAHAGITVAFIEYMDVVYVVLHPEWT